MTSRNIPIKCPRINSPRTVDYVKHSCSKAPLAFPILLVMAAKHSKIVLDEFQAKDTFKALNKCCE